MCVLTLIAASALTVGGCANHAASDAFISPDAGFSDESAARTALLSLPNRVVDLLDIVHVGFGVGPGFGLELHPTRYARLKAMAGADVGLGWFGRHARPTQAAAHASAAAGVAEASASAGPMWRVPKWDIGVYYHALIDMIYVGIAPDEFVDFLAGFATYDTKDDDF
jgi:hypothetical protein